MYPPATSVGGTTSAEPVNHQPAAPASGSLHIVQDPIHDPPCIVSPYAYDAVATLLPVGSAVVDEHISGGPCINCCKECDDKLTLVIKAADVNSITISRPCKLGALAGKRIDRRFQDIEEQTKQALTRRHQGRDRA